MKGLNPEHRLSDAASIWFFLAELIILSGSIPGVCGIAEKRFGEELPVACIMILGRQTVRRSCPSCLCPEAAVGGDGLFPFSLDVHVCRAQTKDLSLLVKSIG